MSCKDLSLYIHIPFCVSKCDYCDFFSIAAGCKDPVPSDYINALCNEIFFRVNEYGPYKIKTVYIGGGTPSLLKKDALRKISQTINGLDCTDNIEFTVEVNPDDVTPELLDNLEQAGVNRISCGIQSFCDDVLKKAHRRSDEKTVYAALDLIAHNWNKTISADLICGLPGETEKSMLKGLGELVQRKIPHISFYSLCIEEETPLGNAILNGSQKYDQDYSDELWIKGRDYLLKNGYIQYEVSNFCLPGYECAHNMTYWMHKDYIGCGSGATGTIYNMPLWNLNPSKKGEGIRYTNTKNIAEYIDFWSKNPTESAENPVKLPQDVEKIIHQTSKFEYFMMGLRTVRGISPQEYQMIFEEPVPPKIMQMLESESKKTDKGRFFFDSEKLLFLNSFLEELLQILE